MSNVTNIVDERMKRFATKINGETIREQVRHNIALEDCLRYFVYCAEHRIAPDSEQIEAAKELIA
jgi:hypothetical protein